MKPAPISNCFLHFNIRTAEQGVAQVWEDDLFDKEVIQDLEGASKLGYRNPMDIQGLLYYHEEEVVLYIHGVDNIIEEHL